MGKILKHLEDIREGSKHIKEVKEKGVFCRYLGGHPNWKITKPHPCALTVEDTSVSVVGLKKGKIVGSFELPYDKIASVDLTDRPGEGKYGAGMGQALGSMGTGVGVGKMKNLQMMLVINAKAKQKGEDITIPIRFIMSNVGKNYGEIVKLRIDQELSEGIEI